MDVSTEPPHAAIVREGLNVAQPRAATGAFHSDFGRVIGVKVACRVHVLLLSPQILRGVIPARRTI